MTSSAIILMLAAFILVWGGLIGSIIHLRSADTPDGDFAPEAGETANPEGPIIAPRDL